jgi:hypothetical protein
MFAVKTFSLKLPVALLREIKHEAVARNVAKAAIVRDCIEQTLRRRTRSKKQTTCLELMGDLVGSFNGPRDLSTTRPYLTKISRRLPRASE